MKQTYKLVIVGAGPAGLTAALYAARAGIKTLVFDKMMPGGQILLTEKLENFPGFADGVNTHEFIQNLTTQVKNLNVEIKQEEIIKIIDRKDTKLIKTDQGEYGVKVAILAVGAQPRRLGVIGEDKLIGRGVSYCAVCDGPLFRKKEVAVVGGGDKALEEALYLAKLVKKVYLIHRRDKFRGSKILQERISKLKNVECILSSIVIEMQGETRLENLVLENKLDGKTSKLNCDGIFVAIGSLPQTSFLKDLIQLDDDGYILSDANFLTNIAGIFTCGDCRRNSFKQVVSACSEGAQAANSALIYLDSLS